MTFQKDNQKVEYTYNLKTNRIISSTEEKNLGGNMNRVMVGYYHNGWEVVSNGKTELEDI